MFCRLSVRRALPRYFCEPRLFCAARRRYVLNITPFSAGAIFVIFAHGGTLPAAPPGAFVLSSADDAFRLHTAIFVAALTFLLLSCARDVYLILRYFIGAISPLLLLFAIFAYAKGARYFDGAMFSTPPPAARAVTSPPPAPEARDRRAR